MALRCLTDALPTNLSHTPSAIRLVTPRSCFPPPERWKKYIDVAILIPYLLHRCTYAGVPGGFHQEG